MMRGIGGTRIWLAAVCGMAFSSGCESDLNQGSFRPAITTRASVAKGQGQGNRDSLHASVSADGRYVAFETTASNLHPDDTDISSDVYVKDLETGDLILVSRADGASGAKGTNGSMTYYAMEAVISANGRYVAFEAQANNLDAAASAAGGEGPKVYVRDLLTFDTFLVSRADGGSGVKKHGKAPSISADGRFVAYESLENGQEPSDPDSNGFSDVYVRDVLNGTTRLASRKDGATGVVGSAGSFDAAISGSGEWVAFWTQSTNLDAADTSSDSDVYARQLVSPFATLLISRASGATGAKAQMLGFSAQSDQPAISYDGRYVAFVSTGDNLVAGDLNGKRDVFVRDRIGLTTVRVSVDSRGRESTRDSANPHLSDDGRFVLFDSDSPTFVDGDTNNAVDVFLRDLTAGATTRVSVRTFGDQAAMPSSEPIIVVTPASRQGRMSGDGRYVVFESNAFDMVEADSNGVTDVFARGPLY